MLFFLSDFLAVFMNMSLLGFAMLVSVATVALSLFLPSLQMPASVFGALWLYERRQRHLASDVRRQGATTDNDLLC
jgi:hypothetical protein